METSEEEEGWLEPGGGHRVALLPSAEAPPSWLPPYRLPPPTAIFTHPVRRLVFSRAPQGLWMPAPGSQATSEEGDLASYLDGLVRYTKRAALFGGIAGRTSTQWVPVKQGSAAEMLAERERRLKGHENVTRLRAVRAVPGGGVALYEETHDFTLRDLIWYSPDLLSAPAQLFVVYQLLATLCDAHDLGVTHGSLVPELVLLQVYASPEAKSSGAWVRLSGLGGWSAPSHRISSLTWQKMLHLWQSRQISNLQYLLWVNEAAGRRAGDPSAHPVLPWVSDFSTRTGKLRDLTKSKFRLTKGDEQLDATYADGVPAGAHAAHHVPYTLSALSYYNYTARRTPVPILQRFVRSHFQAGEYPASVQRLYEWSPDEAVPELYTDPSIFRSRHPQMPDLALPDWATDVEDFLAAHRAILESDSVSAQLHVWLDLTFGVLQRGAAAVAAKNVVLFRSSEPRNHGFLVLFPVPHPPRGVQPSEPGAPSSGAALPASSSSSSSQPSMRPSASMWDGAPIAPSSPVAPPPPPRRPVLSALLEPLKRRSLSPFLAPSPHVSRVVPPPSSPALSSQLQAKASAAPPALALSLSAPALMHAAPVSSANSRFVESLLLLENRNFIDAANANIPPPPPVTKTSLDDMRATDACALAELIERLYGTAPLAGPLLEGTQALPVPLAHLARVLRSHGLHVALQEPVFPASFPALLAFLRRFFALADLAPRADLLREALAKAEAWPAPILLPFVRPLLAQPAPASVQLALQLGHCDWSGSTGGYWEALRPLFTEWYSKCPSASPSPVLDELLSPAFLEAAWRLRLYVAPSLLSAHLAALCASAAKSHSPSIASLRWLHGRWPPLLSSRMIAEPLASALSAAEGQGGVDFVLWLCRELGEALVSSRIVPKLLRVVQEHASRAARTDQPLLSSLLVLTHLADTLLSPSAALRFLVPLRGQSSVLMSLLLNPPPHPPTLQALSALIVALTGRAGNPAAAAVPYLAQFFAPYAALYDAQGRWRGKPEEAKIYSPEMALLLWAPLAAIVPGLAANVPAAPLLDALARRAALSPPPPLSGLMQPRSPQPLEPAAIALRSSQVRQSSSAPPLPAVADAGGAAEDEEEWATASPSGTSSSSSSSSSSSVWYANRGPDVDGEEPLEMRVLHTFRAHYTPLKSISLLADAERMFMSTAVKDPIIRLWSSAEARVLRTLNSHRSPVIGAEWLDREAVQLGSCEASEALLWDVETGRVILRADPPSVDYAAIAALNAAAAPSANHVLLLATADAGLHLWDVRSGDTQELRLPTGGAAVRTLAAEQDAWVAAGLSSGIAVQLDLRTGSVLQQWRLSDAPVQRLVTRSRHAMLASCAERSGVQMWSSAQSSMQLERTYRGLPEAPAAWAVHGESLVCALGARIAHGPVDAPVPFVNLTVRKLHSTAPRSAVASLPSVCALASMPLTNVLLAGTESGHIKIVV